MDEAAQEIVRLQKELADCKQAQEVLLQQQTELEARNARLRNHLIEVHYRVKNSLQVLAAMIELHQLEPNATVSGEKLAHLRRLMSMIALLHDLLMQRAIDREEEVGLSIATFLQRLMAALWNWVPDRTFSLEVEDGEMNRSAVMGLGLLASELVSNALKHGAGTVEVRLKIHEDRAVFEVRDQGPGFPADFNPTSDSTFGLEFVESVAQHDLHGTVRFENRAEGGASVQIDFPLSKLIKAQE